MTPESNSASSLYISEREVGKSIVVPSPTADQSVAVEASPGGNLTLSFDPSTTDSSRDGNDLIMQTEDGGQIVMTNFFAVGENALPTFTLPDGTVVDAADLLESSGVDITTAAGPAGGGANGGGTSYDDFPGSLISGVDKLGVLDTFQWNRDTEIPEFSVINTNTLMEIGGDAPIAGGGLEKMALFLEITNHDLGKKVDFKNSYGYYIKEYDENGNLLPPKEGVIIWADTSAPANLNAKITLEFGEDFDKDSLGFFIIPNGGGDDLVAGGTLNDALTDGAKVVFGDDGKGNIVAFLPGENGNPDVQLHGQNGWDLRLDTDIDSNNGQNYMITDEHGGQRWEDLPWTHGSGKWFDNKDIDLTLEWSTKRVVYGSDENETLFSADGPDLFYWNSSAFGGADTIENFDSSHDKLVFAGLLNGDNNALDELLNNGSLIGDTFSATKDDTYISLSVAGDAATLQLTSAGNTQTIEIHGGIQAFADSMSDEASATAFLQQIINIGG